MSELRGRHPWGDAAGTDLRERRPRLPGTSPGHSGAGNSVAPTEATRPARAHVRTHIRARSLGDEATCTSEMLSEKGRHLT